MVFSNQYENLLANFLESTSTLVNLQTMRSKLQKLEFKERIRKRIKTV